jgi:putative membrane protein
MIDRWLTFAGIGVLLLAWAGPLPAMVAASFAAHMTLHMTVVGIGIPLLAAGIGTWVAAKDWLRSQVALPVAVSVLDLLVVWGWHAPALHHASRTLPWALAAEQLSFALVSLLVWLVALASTAETRRSAALAGAMALFFTSMHMTLLGALIGLAPRPIYGHRHHPAAGLPVLADQQLGGVIMLAIGGVIYLAGGLVLMARVLQRKAAT